MTENPPNILNNELQIEQETNNHLMSTATWAKVTAVAGFIISVLIVVFAYLFASQLSQRSVFFRSGGMSTEQQIAVAFYIITAVVHAILSYLQFRFATNIQIALRSTDQYALNKGFQHLKSFAIIRGIVSIIMAIFLILGVLGIAGR